jgi:hypothetical protein
MTSLKNHAEVIAAIDMCVVPTLTFDRLFACLVLGHGRRQLLWFEVTRHPTAHWLGRQITEAFPWASAPAGRFDYAAIGTVSNFASRLCDEAKPGQILISPRVLIAVEKDITVEPVGYFALKGIRRPLTAYNVLTSKAAD